jgi:hypothetical protein
VFADLEVGALTRIMRPTIWSAMAAGAVAAGIAVLLSSTPAAVGIVLGIGVAILNVRMLGAAVTKLEVDAPGATGSAPGADSADSASAGHGGTAGAGSADNKVVRRILRTRSAVRLVLITLVTIGLVLVNPPLGIGLVVGLVIFQIAFVLNAGRAILSAGIV